MIVRILRDLSRIAWTWSVGDRIRASPREGAYYRIQPGDVLTVCGNDVHVVNRSVVETEDGQSLYLTCQTESGEAELRIALTTQVSGDWIVWVSNGDTRVVSTNELQVWSRGQWTSGLHIRDASK